jgi:hypothetical protein
MSDALPSGALSAEDVERLGVPVGGPDPVIARAIALPPPWRAQATGALLDEMIEACAALPEGVDRLRITAWCWRLFPFAPKDASDDPQSYLAFEPTRLVQMDRWPQVKPWRTDGLPPDPNRPWPPEGPPPFMRARIQVPFDEDAFAHRFMPSLFSPILLRGALLDLWSEPALRIQKLSSATRPDSAGAGAFELRRDFDPAAYLRHVHSEKGASFCERLAFEREFPLVPPFARNRL